MIEQVFLWFLIMAVGAIAVAILIYGFIQFLAMVSE